MVFQAYLTYFEAKNDAGSMSGYQRSMLELYIFFGKRHMFCDQFYLRNTTEVIKSAYEVILGHK